MKQKIKYYLYDNFPNVIARLIIIRRQYKECMNLFATHMYERKIFKIVKNIDYFDSSNMTYDQLIQITFKECYNFFEKTDLIYFGEVSYGSHRFIITPDKLNVLELKLMALIHEGYIVEVHNEKGVKKCIVNKNMSIKKFKNKIKDFTLIRCYKVYKNSQGVVEFASKTAFEIEKWNKRGNIYTTESKNMIQNKLSETNLTDTIEIELFGKKVYQLCGTNLYFNGLKKDVVEDIDLVYTWVDTGDKEWMKKKSEYMVNYRDSLLHPSAISDNRFISRDELKYSLRSVQKYFSGYRKIFIVTDSQKPDWILESDNVIMINHSDIFPDVQVLPVFNSHAIETCLHKIEGLSEHYLYLNDDILFGSPVNKMMFFPKKDMIGIFPSTQTYIPFDEVSSDILPVDSAAINTRNLLKQEGYGFAINKFKHTPLPQIKSRLLELENKFKLNIDETRRSRFRQPIDVSMTSSLFFNYMYFKNNAQVLSIKYAYINLGCKKHLYKLLNIARSPENERPDVFCINDVEGETNNEETIRLFLAAMTTLFPTQSQFEKIKK